ncbi:MAG: hypothetical protein JOS17DRAFT_496906 [Linnemannia elongata]|nr:MAG: hypothetical protein JOS17DRAFT_496906 [Linnemannia elongata]
MSTSYSYFCFYAIGIFVLYLEVRHHSRLAGFHCSFVLLLILGFLTSADLASSFIVPFFTLSSFSLLGSSSHFRSSASSFIGADSVCTALRLALPSS